MCSAHTCENYAMLSEFLSLVLCNEFISYRSSDWWLVGHGFKSALFDFVFSMFSVLIFFFFFFLSLFFFLVGTYCSSRNFWQLAIWMFWKWSIFTNHTQLPGPDYYWTTITVVLAVSSRNFIASGKNKK